MVVPPSPRDMKAARVLSVGLASEVKVAEGAVEVQLRSNSYTPMPIEKQPAVGSYTPMPVEAQPASNSYTPMPVEAQPASNSYTPMPVEAQPVVGSYTPMPVSAQPATNSYTPTAVGISPGGTTILNSPVGVVASPVAAGAVLVPRSASYVPSVASGAPPSTVTVLPATASFSMERVPSQEGLSVVLPRVNSFTGGPRLVQAGTPIEAYDRSGTKVLYVPTPMPRQLSLSELAAAPTQVLPATAAIAPTAPGQQQEEESSEEEEEGVLDTFRNYVFETSELVKSTAVTAAATVQARAAELGPMITSGFQSPSKERPTTVSFAEGTSVQVVQAPISQEVAAPPATLPSIAASQVVQPSALASTRAVMPEIGTSRAAPPRVTPVLEDGKLWMLSDTQTTEDQELHTWRQKAPVDLWLIDNSTLQGTTPGLGLRKTIEINNKDGQACIPWGSIVEARSISQDWLETMTFKGVRYLPRYITGIQVVTPYGSPAGTNANLSLGAGPPTTASFTGVQPYGMQIEQSREVPMRVDSEPRMETYHSEYGGSFVMLASSPTQVDREMPIPTRDVIPMIVEPAMAQTMPQTVPSNLGAASYPATGSRPATTSGVLYPPPLSAAPYDVPSTATLLKSEAGDGQANGEMSKLFSTISGLFVGSMGVVCNTKTGMIREVMDGQAKKVGVRPGWTVKQIDGQPYDDTAMVKAIESKKPYQVSFEVPVTNLQAPGTAPELIANEPPQTYFAGAAYGTLPETVHSSLTYPAPAPVISPRDGSPGVRSARVLGTYNAAGTPFQYESSTTVPASAVMPASLDTRFAAQYSPRYVEPTRVYTTGSNILQQETLNGGSLVQDWSGSLRTYGTEGPIFSGAPSPISHTLPVAGLSANSFVEEAPIYLPPGAPSPISQTQGGIMLDGLGETQDGMGRIVTAGLA